MRENLITARLGAAIGVRQPSPDPETILNVSALIPAILAKLEGLPSGHAMDLRTYKRNRSVIILKKDEDSFLFLENGFYRDRLIYILLIARSEWKDVKCSNLRSLP